jgi:hypothetical protein
VAHTTDSRAEAPHDHLVQFYDREDELVAGVGTYLAEAIEAGGVAVVIATDAHRQAFAARLADAGVDPALAEVGLPASGAALVMLDAREAADALLIDGRVAPHRFDKLIGDLVREAAAGGRPVRAYGEIVAVLWAAGQVAAALELEALWNGLGREVDFSLYCGYPRTLVEAEGGAEPFSEVCRLHSAVVGTDIARPSLQDPALEVKVRFRWSGRGPAQARHFVTDTLAAWGRADLIDDAALIVSELATNAVLHARTDFTVTLSRLPEGTIRLAVRDASMARPRPRRAGPLDGSGRGLGLVAAFATGWGAEFLPDGKVVWAELTRPRFRRGRGAALTAR